MLPCAAEHDPEKPVPDLTRDGPGFRTKIMLKLKVSHLGGYHHMYACLRMSLVATALISTSVVANAADVQRPPPRSPIATIYDWTGFYVGGHVGGGWVDNGDSSFLGGGQVGYNFQMGPWV